MKKDWIFILLHYCITFVIIFGAEYIFGKLVIHRVMTKGNSLISSAYIWGSIGIVTLGIVGNCLMNRFCAISPNAILLVNVIAALISGGVYVILCDKQGRGLLDYVDYSHETDYFVIVILAGLVLCCSIFEGIVWRILYKILLKR